MKEIKNWKVTKSLFGHKVSFRCPNCSIGLVSKLDEAGGVDECPDCAVRFEVPGEQQLIAFRKQKEKVISESLQGRQIDQTDNIVDESAVVDAVLVESTVDFVPEKANGSNEPVCEIHQLDETEFLITNLSKLDVFQRLQDAVSRNYKVSGAYEKSGKIRGSGVSGFSFLIECLDHTDGIVIRIDGEAPQGPINFEAWFNPTSIGGWGLLAAAETFNSAVNRIAANELERDVRLLLANIYFSVGVASNDFAAIRTDEYTFETCINEYRLANALGKLLKSTSDYGIPELKGLIDDALLPLSGVTTVTGPVSSKVHPEDLYIRGTRPRSTKQPKYSLSIGIGEVANRRTVVICSAKPSNLMPGFEGRNYYNEVAKRYSTAIEDVIKRWISEKRSI